MRVGDVIGFHVINKAIIPYDIEAGEPESFYYLMTDKNPPINGPAMLMDMSVEDGTRVYSLVAKITPSKL